VGSDHADAMTAELDLTDASATPEALAELLPSLRRLDRLLERAAADVPATFGAHVPDDRFRGLYVGEADLAPLLRREPGAPTFGGTDVAWRDDETPAPGSRLAWLADEYTLARFDLDVIVLALAADVDLRYERLYAYLHDDVTRRRPSVDLALNLFCATAAERIARRTHFGPESPLVRCRLVELTGDPTGPLLAQAITLDEQVTNLLLGQATLDRRLAAICRYDTGPHDATDAVQDDARVRALADAVGAAIARDEGMRVRLHGARGTGKRRFAVAVAAAADVPLLTIDLGAAVEGRDADRLLELALREGALHGALVFVHDGDALLADGRERLRTRLEEAIGASRAIVVLASERAWPADALPDAIEITLTLPDAERRNALWREAVADTGHAVTRATAAAVATRFRLTPRHIAAAAASAARRAEWHAMLDGGDAPETLASEHVFAAAREQSRRELAALAARIEPVHTWEELILPDDSLEQLREMARRVAHREQVLGTWGFAARLPRGRGVNALFSGPSGTGKTMAAEILAGELGLDLYRVELAGVVSKYIGETEKNLDRIFTAAEGSNGIVFFDEADALFGKRSEVHDAHDRYANIEISYLLQKMESFDGIAILATNLRGNLDQAFVRRLAFTVHFPFPDEESRRRIWRNVWPSAVPLDADADFDFLARQFALSGGNIRNIALAAAFLAAERGGSVAMRDLIAATRREYQKLGKTLTEAELGGRPEAGA
jgi:SpoVK/Ycf46/Vps4 family AAA+-type ATPase